VITGAMFVIAAAAGALLRAEAGRRWNQTNGVAVGTLIVNVTGSFCLGLLSHLGQPAITIVGVGGLGAYTTFSSFARDAVALAKTAQVRQAVGYVVASCVLGISAAALGVALSNS